MHRVVQPSPPSILDHFHNPKRNPCPLAITPSLPTPPSPTQPLIYLLFLVICLLWIFHITWSFVNGFFLDDFWSRADSTCQRELLWNQGRPRPAADGIKSRSPSPVPSTILSTLHVFTPFILTAAFWGRHSHSPWFKLSGPMTTMALSHSFYVS